MGEDENMDGVIDTFNIYQGAYMFAMLTCFVSILARICVL